MYYDLFIFFFFKQKTAYEMRISDWSSDVCSSDLPIIPPSILMILYGFAAQQSVISLFLGGIVPGLMLSFTFAALAFWISYRRRYGAEEVRFSLKVPAASLVSALPALSIPVIIVVGVVGGVFTSEERRVGKEVVSK